MSGHQRCLGFYVARYNTMFGPGCSTVLRPRPARSLPAKRTAPPRPYSDTQFTPKPHRRSPPPTDHRLRGHVLPVDSCWRRRVHVLALVAAGMLIPAACSIDDEPEPRPIATSTKQPIDNEPTLPPFPMPDTPVGRQAQWIVDVLNNDQWPLPAELEEHLAPTGADEAMATLNEARGEGPFYAVDLDVVGSEAVMRLRPAPNSPDSSPIDASE